MKLNQLLTDDDAVSPVIGVILMVAITVILAAVIGTFVLGLGDQVQTTAPNANFDFDYSASSDELEVTHTGGDGVNGDELFLSGAINTSDTAYGSTPPEDMSWGEHDHGTDAVTSGQSVTVMNTSAAGDVDKTMSQYAWADGVFEGGDVADGTEVSVVWQDADSDQSSTLRTWTRG